MNTSYDAFNEWINSLPTEEGFRNDTVVKIVREGLGRGLSQETLQQAVQTYADKSKLPLDEAIQILKRHQKQHAVNPFDSNANKANDEEGIDWVLLGKDFLKTYFHGPSGTTLVLWNSEYYVFDNGCYHKVEDNFIRAKISQYFISRGFKLRKKKLSVIQQEVLNVILGLILIPKDAEPPFLAASIEANDNECEQVKKNWLVMKNSILDLDEYKSSISDPCLPHTRAYFCFNKLPYDYQPHAACPTWLNFLSSVFEENEVISLVQEWFGYNLVSHNKYQKFFLAVGQGSNGKSVLLKVLSLMLGKGNFASVGLESFDPKRSYALAHLSSVMANIVNDLNEIDKTGEGLLKQFVAGEPITVERKYKDHFTMTPTAKLSMATNVLPKFMDRSDGIWRRMIMITFKKQILDESKQDKRLMSDDWWIQSNELPGILNWALEGLRRLENRGHFVIPQSVSKDVEDFRHSSNTASIFLTATVEENEKGICPSTWLYRDYRDFAKENGYMPLNSQNFAKEVRRIFPKAHLTDSTRMAQNPNSMYKHLAKSRDWQGFSYIDFNNNI